MPGPMEPSKEVAQFLQEIAQIRQDAHRRELGGLQEAATTSEEDDRGKIVAVPGGTVETEVWVKVESGIWSTSKKKAPGFTRYFARWRFPTLSLWKRLGNSRQNLFTQEKKVWRVFLTETSLIERPLTFFENVLSDESFDAIMGFSPAMVPTALVRAFLKTTTLSQRDLYQIGKECMELWREGGSVRDPHPLLEEVITAMNMHEKLGVPAWPTVGDIPIRTYAVIQKALASYNEALSQNQKDESARRRAADMAGVRRPVMAR